MTIKGLIYKYWKESKKKQKKKVSDHKRTADGSRMFLQFSFQMTMTSTLAALKCVSYL